MEHFAKSARMFFTKAFQDFIPHFRQVLRFLALPYYFFFGVNWKECKLSPLRVWGDLLYIFFVLRSYPDNYSRCRLFEKPRQDWAYYYGSNYNPFQRGKLFHSVQPPRYRIIFEDKLVCQFLCEGLKLRVPEVLGSLFPNRPILPQLRDVLEQEINGDFFIKPVEGSAGSGVFKVRKVGNDFLMYDNKGQEDDLPVHLSERNIVQAEVKQDEVMASVFEGSLNSIRLLTFSLENGESSIISAVARFGAGEAVIDNWSTGGIAVGVNLENGSLFKVGYNKQGQKILSHPDSGVVFEGFQIPNWQAVVGFACLVQSSFPYYRILGLDVAIDVDGPILIEINDSPDFVFQEQCAGPLLKEPGILAEFASSGLLFNRPQKTILENSIQPKSE